MKKILLAGMVICSMLPLMDLLAGPSTDFFDACKAECQEKSTDPSSCGFIDGLREKATIAPRMKSIVKSKCPKAAFQYKI